MKRIVCYPLVIIVLLATFVFVSSAQNSGNKGAMFKTPKGYMPLDFPGLKGVMMITQKKPEGMFIVYPDKDQTSDDVWRKAQTTIKGMFVHDDKVAVDWTSASLPAHEGIADETGTLWLGSTSEQEIQIAVFVRKIVDTPYVYGHFAMKVKSGKSKEQNGTFLDKDGKGVKEFDDFWRSLGREK